MSIQISPAAVRTNPAKNNSLVKSENNSPNVQASQLANKSVKASKTDTVIFSKEALQKLSDDAAASAKTSDSKEKQPFLKKISVKA